MSCVDKYRELKKKNGAQISKELSRRGMMSGDCRSTDEIICKIVAYDAYHAGRCAGLEEARKKNSEEANAPKSIDYMRKGVMLKDASGNTVLLKLTEEQMRLLTYLINNDWLYDVSVDSVDTFKWDEP